MTISRQQIIRNLYTSKNYKVADRFWNEEIPLEETRNSLSFEERIIFNFCSMANEEVLPALRRTAKIMAPFTDSLLDYLKPVWELPALNKAMLEHFSSLASRSLYAGYMASILLRILKEPEKALEEFNSLASAICLFSNNLTGSTQETFRTAILKGLE